MSTVQRNIVDAQSDAVVSGYPYDSSYWLSPGRIAGFAIGALVVILLFLALLSLAFRRCCRKEKSKAKRSDIAGRPQPPSWQAQHPMQSPYRTDAGNAGWHYPSQGTMPFDRAKSSGPPSGMQRTGHVEQIPNGAPFGRIQRQSPAQHMQQPASTGHSAVVPTSAQPLRPPSVSHVQASAPLEQVRTTAPPGQIGGYALPSQVQSNVRAVPVQGSPRRTYSQDISMGGDPGRRDSSPPPYYPPSPPIPPPVQSTRPGDVFPSKYYVGSDAYASGSAV